MSIGDRGFRYTTVGRGIFVSSLPNACFEFYAIEVKNIRECTAKHEEFWIIVNAMNSVDMILVPTHRHERGVHDAFASFGDRRVTRV